MKSKIYLFIVIGVGVLLIVLLGMLVLREREQEVQEFPAVTNETEHEIEASDKNEIFDKWVEINHSNFWNNPSLFAGRKYNFPNIKFSYPEGWKFSCCNDMDSASVHNIFSSQESDTTLPYIRLTDYSLKACPNMEDACPFDVQVRMTATEKFKQLTSAIPATSVLPEAKITNLNITAFVYQKQEENGKSSKVYLMNLGDDVIEIDFVNYELLSNSQASMVDFLKTFSFENK